MAAPNIVNVVTITGKTVVANVTTVSSNIVTNSAASDQVLKVNSLMISNIDGANTCDITSSILRNSFEFKLTSTITVPADATLIVISKENAIYLEEGDALRIQASANGDLQATCSYEIIQ